MYLSSRARESRFWAAADAGDQYVQVTIEVPKNLNQKQKEALRNFDELTDEKNYQKNKKFFTRLKELFGEDKDK